MGQRICAGKGAAGAQDGAQCATTQSTMEKVLASAAGVNANVMDNTWVVAGIFQHKEDNHNAPDYIKKNAAYRADPRGAERL
eukprot:7970862-Pyramimonas_sp.AAC.1